MPNAAEILTRSLVSHQVDRIFCVPGESYLAAIDALFDAPGIDLVTTRHEGGASFMAVADAKLTGRAGIMFVSRGPGATNASIGVHVAAQEAVPMILFIGQVAREDLGRGAFQEMDYERFFGSVAKWVTQVTDPDELAGAVNQAFESANGGTPGPVVGVLPEDMLLDEAKGAEPKAAPEVLPPPGDGEIAEIAKRLSAVQHPLLIAGGQIGGAQGRTALHAVSESWQVPVAVSWRHQDLFDNTHPNFAAHMGFNMPGVFSETLNEADLVLAVGTRLGDVTT
ncbi:MAG: thiamine pyrophosphate-binding protein, partial [Rhodospirillales bacterium]|nr:thiamine pyrophosphate-binding protein [Rhodospirillales bacterium]